MRYVKGKAIYGFPHLTLLSEQRFLFHCAVRVIVPPFYVIPVNDNPCLLAGAAPELCPHQNYICVETDTDLFYSCEKCRPSYYATPDGLECQRKFAMYVQRLLLTKCVFWQDGQFIHATRYAPQKLQFMGRPFNKCHF